jgi:hypothetical protein
MTHPQRFALAWLSAAALAAVVVTWAGEAALDALAVPAPSVQAAGAGR